MSLLPSDESQCCRRMTIGPSLSDQGLIEVETAVSSLPLASSLPSRNRLHGCSLGVRVFTIELAICVLFVQLWRSLARSWPAAPVP